MKVRFSPEASQDLKDIYLYSAREYSIEQAEEMFSRIESFCIQTLAEFPMIGRERTDLKEGWRSFPIKPYLVFYSINDDIVEINRIYHGSSDYQNKI